MGIQVKNYLIREGTITLKVSEHTQNCYIHSKVIDYKSTSSVKIDKKGRKTTENTVLWKKKKTRELVVEIE